jgi:hypothetical protein
MPFLRVFNNVDENKREIRSVVDVLLKSGLLNVKIINRYSIVIEYIAILQTMLRVTS